MGKNVNYTEAQTLELVAAYEAADSEFDRAVVVNAFAESLEKSKASIRAKLVREGVYVAKEYRTKTGSKAISKEALVDTIARNMGIASEMLVGLEKANKATLVRLNGVITSNRAEIASLKAEMRGEAED